MKKNIKYKKRFDDRNKIIRKNRIYAIILTIIGALTIFIENDITAFIFILMLSVPIFFSKEKIIWDYEDWLK